MSEYIVDIILILLFVFSIINGWRKGFVKMLLSFVAFLVSIFVAYQLMVPFGALLYDNFVRDNAVDAIEKYIDNNIGELSEGEVKLDYDFEEISGELPDYVIEAADALDISLDEILSDIEFDKLDSHSIAETLTDDVLHGVLLRAAESLAFLIVLSVCSALLALAIMLIDKFMRLPVLKQVNKSLGLALGALTGVVKVFVIATVISIVAGIAADTAFARAINSSAIVNAIASTGVEETIVE